MNWTNKLLTHLRIANDDYPACEARYLSIEDWFNHETYMKADNDSHSQTNPSNEQGTREPAQCG